MKKLRITIGIITGILLVLTIAGIMLLIFNENLSVLDTSYEIIGFSLGAAGMIMAVTSQIGSYQDDKRFTRMMAKIDELNREHDTDEKVDAKFQKKLDALMQMDERIYRKLQREKRRASKNK